MTITVSGPPQSRSSTSATSSPLASPTTSGTRSKSPSRTWRNGSSTSRECSRAWASGDHPDLRQAEGSLGALGLDGRPRREASRTAGVLGQGEAADRHEVGRSQQDHPLDRPRRGGERAEGAAGDRAGVDVPGVRRDDGLGDGLPRWREPRAGSPPPSTSARRDRGVERAGDGGGTDGGHDGLNVADRLCPTPP